MTGIPTRVLLFAEEPDAAAYLEATLRVEAAGAGAAGPLVVRRCLAGELAAEAQGGGHDLALLAALDGAGAAWAAEAAAAARLPSIVVCTGETSLPGLARLVRLGADDVLPLAEVNPRRLGAAIVKVLERRWRLAQPRRIARLRARVVSLGRALWLDDARAA